MRDEHLQYFKALFEGRADISWRAWFAQNEAVLKAELPRAVLLRLRLNGLEEAEKLLKEAGVEYTTDPSALRRERHFASFDPSLLDERGRPREDLRRKAYGGVFGMILDGEHDQARKRLEAEIRKIRRKPVLEQMADLADMCFDGETEFTNGNREIGRALLEAVAISTAGRRSAGPRDTAGAKAFRGIGQP